MHNSEVVTVFVLVTFQTAPAFSREETGAIAGALGLLPAAAPPITKQAAGRQRLRVNFPVAARSC